SATSNSFSAPSTFAARPATPAASSPLDQRQAATAATFAQPLGSPAAGFAQAAPAANPAPSFDRGPSLALIAPPSPLSSSLLGAVSSPAWTLAGSGAPAAPAALPAAPGSSQGGGTPRIPTAPPCASGIGASAPGAGAGSGGSAALLAATLDCSAPQGLQPNRLTPSLWRQAAFVSLQERPG
ncbi:MAG TPA: hypothetical protein VF087_13000, partial [Solirubrobacteraceae bacterium]